MDEKVDFGDISTISLSASPAISKTVSNIFTSPALNPPLENRRLPPQVPDIDISGSSHHNLSDSPPPQTGDHDFLEPIVKVNVPVPSSEESSSNGISGIIITHKVEAIAVCRSSFCMDSVN